MQSQTSETITASAVREAMNAAATGRIEEAVRIADTALNSGGDRVALNAMIGTIYCRTGALEDGIRHLQIAHDAKPDDPVIALNLATALANMGEEAQAYAIIPEALADSDPSLRLQRLRAFLAQQTGDFPAAVAGYEKLLKTDPNDIEALNNLGNSRRENGDAAGAVEALRRATAIDPKARPVRFNLASALHVAGKSREAEAEFRAMVEEFPDDWRPLRELYALNHALGREDAALADIEEALKRAPAEIPLLLATASQRMLTGDMDGARAAYEAVIARDPHNRLANVGQAVLLDVSNREDELPRLIEQARQRGVETSVLAFMEAYDHRRAKRYREGLEALAQVPADLESARRFHLLGQLSEGAGEFEQAWDAYERMNAIHRDDLSQPERRAQNYRTLVRSRMEMLTPAAAGEWREPVITDGREPPAFLVGFPRSGTTLLDTFLMGHRNVEVLEEEPSLLKPNTLLKDFEQLGVADDATVAQARDAYFDFVATKADLAGDVQIVDKNPLATNSLPLIRKLFPGGKVVVALRHPCDVVLSCYATNFKLNDGMANFLRLETAAELYDLTFSYLERVRELLPMPIHMVKYEDVVADPQAQLRAVIDFLGLEWDERLIDHQKTARERGRIKTASYAQVVEPIYSRSAGRWRNFRKQMEPVLPVLQPWIDKFGYE